MTIKYKNGRLYSEVVGFLDTYRPSYTSGLEKKCEEKKEEKRKSDIPDGMTDVKNTVG